MPDEYLKTVANLLRMRNEIDGQIAAVIGRPMTAGHLGEWIASQVFGIDLELSAASAAYDGRLLSGTLRDRTVNVKWYLKRDGLIDVTESEMVDYYLVMTGPSAPAGHSRGGVRPWTLESVYLFDARQLLGELRTRGVKIGTASSVLGRQWVAAEIFPEQRNTTLLVQPEQAALLRLFAAPR